MTRQRLNFLRQNYLHFSEVYADYVMLRKQLLQMKMEREFRRKLALEMGKILEQYGLITGDLMAQLRDAR